MPELYPYAPPDGTEVLIAWLSPLGQVRAEKPYGAVLPFRMVRRIGGGSDRITDKGLYSVHTFAASAAEAMAEGLGTHRRMLKIAWPGGPADDIECTDEPRIVQWDKLNTIYRAIGTYRVDLRALTGCGTTR